MEKSTKSLVIGVVIGIAVALVAVRILPKGSVGNGEEKDTKTDAVKKTDGKDKNDPPNPPKPHPKPSVIKKPSVKPQAINRVFSKWMKGQFEMKGRGTDAKWGIGTTANFKYSIFVIAESKILSKKALPDGTIEVEEIRKFDRVQDGIAVSKLDFVLALDTLPLETFSKTIDVTAKVWGTVTGNPAGHIVKLGKDFVLKELKQIDGKSVRKIMGELGVELPAEIEIVISKIISDQMLRGFGGLRDISGKSYRFQYNQGKDGTPLSITFKNEDGSEVTSEEEQMILKRVNAFIDYNAMPNTESRPGDSWTVNAEDIQEVFDPFVDGTYTGRITVERRDDTKDGDWFVEMKPGSSITVISGSGASRTTNGTLQLTRGRAIINPDKYTVKEMFVAGNAGLKRLSKHHFLFTARISGRCDFQGRVVSFPIKDTAK